MDEKKHGFGMVMMGIGLLIAAAMLFFGLPWWEIFAVLGLLAIVKGLICKFKK